MVNEEHAEFLLLPQIEYSLQKASSIPYNNATNVYESAGVETDRAFGGSCLYKLAELLRTLPPEASDTKTIFSQAGSIAHYAILMKLGNSHFYLDPFLWQKKLLNLNDPEGTTVETIEQGLVIQKQPTPENSILSTSLIDTSHKARGVLTSHDFTRSLNFLPRSSALPISPHFPGYSMQIPDVDGKHIYKVWYLKKDKMFVDVWITDTVTGERTRIPNSGINSEMREEVFGRITSVIGKSQQELLDFFIGARELELVMSQLMDNSTDHPPHEGE